MTLQAFRQQFPEAMRVSTNLQAMVRADEMFRALEDNRNSSTRFAGALRTVFDACEERNYVTNFQNPQQAWERALFNKRWWWLTMVYGRMEDGGFSMAERLFATVQTMTRDLRNQHAGITLPQLNGRTEQHLDREMFARISLAIWPNILDVARDVKRMNTGHYAEATLAQLGTALERRIRENRELEQRLQGLAGQPVPAGATVPIRDGKIVLSVADGNPEFRVRVWQGEHWSAGYKEFMSFLDRVILPDDCELTQAYGVRMMRNVHPDRTRTWDTWRNQLGHTGRMQCRQLMQRYHEAMLRGPQPQPVPVADADAAQRFQEIVANDQIPAVINWLRRDHMQSLSAVDRAAERNAWPGGWPWCAQQPCETCLSFWRSCSPADRTAQLTAAIEVWARVTGIPLPVPVPAAEQVVGSAVPVQTVPAEATRFYVDPFESTEATVCDADGNRIGEVSAPIPELTAYVTVRDEEGNALGELIDSTAEGMSMTLTFRPYERASATVEDVIAQADPAVLIEGLRKRL